jgi:3-hydroxyisobutyrate dehydrogenase
MQAEPVAVLGAGGTMGFPMAQNLARAWLEVRAWNRTKGKADALAADGASIATCPAEAADGAGLVLTMLADADAVIEAMDGFNGALSTMGDDAIWLQMSTIGEAGTVRCADLAASRGVAFVDAPVLGTRQPAEEGKVVVLASGDTSVRERVRPVFDALAGKTIWVGDVGAGTRLKLAVNSWVLAVVESGAETIALTEGLGLDPQLLFDALAGTALDLPYLRMKSKLIGARDFPPAFTLRLAAKDAALAAESAQQRDLDLPLLRTVRRRLAEGAQRYGDLDMSATYLTSAPKSLETP